MTDSYSGGYDRGKRSSNPLDDLIPQGDHPGEDLDKVKRDVRSVKKFIEVALVLDKAMFDKRPHSSRKDVIHDAIQVANIADMVTCNLSIILKCGASHSVLSSLFSTSKTVSTRGCRWSTWKRGRTRTNLRASPGKGTSNKPWLTFQTMPDESCILSTRTRRNC